MNNTRKFYKESHIETFVIYPKEPLIKKLMKNTPQSHSIDIYKPITAFVIYGYGRLGNNILQILNALSVARDLSVKKIYVPSYFWFINTSLRYGGFVFSKDWNIMNENFFSDNFYYYYKGIFFNQSKSLDIVGKHLESQIHRLNLTSEKLTIHIRSGDIFKRKMPSNYAQPPLCFYTQMLNYFKIQNIEVYAEDNRNPVVNELKKRNIKINHADLITTVSNIFYSRNVMIGFGTFAVSICRVSSIPKNIYMFGAMQYHIGFVAKHIKVSINKMTDEFKRIIYPWHNSVQQRAYLIQCRCSIIWMPYKYYFNNSYQRIM